MFLHWVVSGFGVGGDLWNALLARCALLVFFSGSNFYPCIHRREHKLTYTVGAAGTGRGSIYGDERSL